MIPYRNARDAHAQDIVVNNYLLLPFLKRWAQYTRLPHATQIPEFFSVPVPIEYSVALTNSSPVIPPPPPHSQQSPSPLHICVPPAGIILFSVVRILILLSVTLSCTLSPTWQILA